MNLEMLALSIVMVALTSVTLYFVASLQQDRLERRLSGRIDELERRLRYAAKQSRTLTVDKVELQKLAREVSSLQGKAE